MESLQKESWGCENCDYIGDKTTLQDHVIGSHMEHKMKPLQKESEWKVKVRDWWYSIQDAQKCPDEIKRVEIEHIIREALTQRGKERSGFELDNGTIGVSASTVSLQKESEWDEEFDELTKSMDGQFRPKLRLLFRKAITTAVSKRDAYFVEEVRKKATISEIAVSNIEVKPVKLVRLDDVLSILKH